jgi:S1-C subfamily serine protease
MVGDIILRIGDEQIKGQVDFYRKLWGKGPAGTEIPLSVLQGAQMKELVIESMERTDHLRKRTTY